MPGMDGIETLHLIKERKLCEGVPVVMLTANSLKGDKEKYLDMALEEFKNNPRLMQTKGIYVAFNLFFFDMV